MTVTVYGRPFGRPDLPSVPDLLRELGHDIRADEPFPGDPPLVLSPTAGPLTNNLEEAACWLAGQMESFDWLLVHYGAIALRGFPVRDSTSFARFLRHYPIYAPGYAGGATPRNAIEGSVYEATQVPASVTILLHQEMAYLRQFPVKIAFFCARPPQSGGETTLGDFRRFESHLPSRFLDTLTAKGLTYHRNFRPSGSPHPCDGYPTIYHATFSQGFGTDDRGEIEQICQGLDMEFEWEADGTISTRLSKAAFTEHPLSGDPVYFNHILTQIIDPAWMGDLYEPYLDIYDRAGRARPYNVTYGDGSPVSAEDHARVSDGVASVTVAPGWQAGDVLLVDNVYTGHGRNPFVGARDVQVMLFDGP